MLYEPMFPPPHEGSQFASFIPECRQGSRNSSVSEPYHVIMTGIKQFGPSGILDGPIGGSLCLDIMGKTPSDSVSAQGIPCSEKGLFTTGARCTGYPLARQALTMIPQWISCGSLFSFPHSQKNRGFIFSGIGRKILQTESSFSSVTILSDLRNTGTQEDRALQF